jgi:hypothetical protein
MVGKAKATDRPGKDCRQKVILVKTVPKKSASARQMSTAARTHFSELYTCA